MRSQFKEVKMAALCFSYIFLVFAAACTILSFGLPSWLMYIEGNTVKYVIGLWETCVDTSCFPGSASREAVVKLLGGWFYLVQITASAGVIFLFVTVCTMVLYLCIRRASTIRIAAISSAVSGIFYALALGVFLIGVKTKHLSPDSVLLFDFSFYSGLVGVACLVITATLMFCIYRGVANRPPEYTQIN